MVTLVSRIGHLLLLLLETLRLPSGAWLFLSVHMIESTRTRDVMLPRLRMWILESVMTQMLIGRFNVLLQKSEQQR